MSKNFFTAEAFYTNGNTELITECENTQELHNAIERFISNKSTSNKAFGICVLAELANKTLANHYNYFLNGMPILKSYFDFLCEVEFKNG